MDQKLYRFYKLTNTIDDEIYIGSTSKSLKYRLQKHKNKSHEYPNRKLYASCNFVGWNNISIIELDTSFTHLHNARQIEQNFIDLHNPSLNISRAIKIQI